MKRPPSGFKDPLMPMKLARFDRDTSIGHGIGYLSLNKLAYCPLTLEQG